MDTLKIKPYVHFKLDYKDEKCVEVAVPTEGHDGLLEWCHVQFRRSDHAYCWEFEISDSLIRQAPEAVHAVLGLALMELRSLSWPSRSD